MEPGSLTECQGTGKFCSLYRGFVTQRLVKSRFHCTKRLSFDEAFTRAFKVIQVIVRREKNQFRSLDLSMRTIKYPLPSPPPHTHTDTDGITLE